MDKQTEGIYCKYCTNSVWEQEPSHGKIVYYCKKKQKVVNKFDTCDEAVEKRKRGY